MIRGFVAAIALMARLSATPAMAQQFGSVPGWNISHLTPEACMAQTSYPDGTWLAVGLNSGGKEPSVTMALHNSAWTSVAEGKRYDFSVQFLDGSQFTVYTVGAGRGVVASNLNRDFMKGMHSGGMTLFLAGQQFGSYQLNNATNAFRAVISCVTGMSRGELF
jgi:hypothetical protein